MSDFAVERARQMFQHRQKARQAQTPQRDGDEAADRDGVGTAADLIGALQIVHSRLRRMDGWLRHRHRLNLTDMHILARIPAAPPAPGAADGGYTAARLAEAVGMSPSGLSRLVDRLVQRGLVARADDVWDKRVTHLVLTEHGRAVRDAVLPEAMDRIHREGAQPLLAYLSRLAAQATADGTRPQGR